MTKVIAILLLLAACKFKMSTQREEQQAQVPERMREVISLSAQEGVLASALCQALDQKRALFRNLHNDKSFDFLLEEHDCGAKVSTPITATLKASVGRPMIYEAPVGSKLYFTDVLTSTEGITHFVCEKVATGKLIQNTIVISNIETIQIRLGGSVADGIILEIWDYVANARGEQVFKELQSIKFHAKLSNVSDFTGLEIDRSISKKCPTDGKLTSGSLQKSLESLP